MCFCALPLTDIHFVLAGVLSPKFLCMCHGDNEIANMFYALLNNYFEKLERNSDLGFP